MVRRLIPARRPPAALTLGLLGALGMLGAVGVGVGVGSPGSQPGSAGFTPIRAANASPPEATASESSSISSDTPSDAPLDVRIDELITAAALPPELRVGISVVDLASGDSLYAREADTALNPASNAKLVTTAAALARLGPEHRYVTRVWVDASSVENGVVAGKLYFEGGGDPSLVTGEIYELAGQLQAAGITKIRGPIVVDASRFDHDGLPPGFDQKDEFASHRAPGGAMSVNYNTYEVFARPSETIGAAPVLSVQPAIPSLVLDASHATTVAGTRNQLWVATEEKNGKTIVSFHGEVGVANGRSSYRYPISDPSRYAGELLALALSQRGVKLSKTKIETGEVPRDAELVASFRSESLSELCRGVNKFSNNFMAEQILRTLAPGAHATAEASLEQLRAYTREIGMPQAGLVLGNGSGLYANNLISPRALTYLLGHVYNDFRYRSDFLASLAIMGADGTTRSRLQDSDARDWVRVKTGTLDDVSALSGYAGAIGRDPIAFSIIFNGLERKHRGAARGLQDSIAALLAAEAAKTAG
ncbi:D-alanyl-D-alanine carboxypeptidase/D-alanyl-D-alanine endopeptidase [Enhygromyxa salina]|uniref:D-alanyl-D-alanine carboxypeptidase DacC n=1 Tax=Enhygromyxa salina TaxID=215803 RepID=A0A2S9Y3G2_9BACT|nr:D-alanyl-D-alanine carboxypeptidase/D-alanyl-D-alanine-endopeptidase [Enhygromyxa salina]PRP99632.1 D-alanyl-D-alanine carboxypeptidase DacC precursor [Enhygromyxa salina]